MTERGQAELVGYALVFSAIVLTVGLVTVGGQAGLVELRDSQRTAGMETGFSVLATNVDDVVRGGVPSRATELKLSGGSLSMGEPVTVTVESGGQEFETSLRPVVYEAPNGARLVYTTGAVIVSGEDGGAAMVREPQLLLDPSRTIIPVINTSFDRQQRGTGAGSIGGESRVLVRTERNAPVPTTSTNTDVDLTITIDSARASAWEPYLESEIGSENCTAGTGFIRCTYTTGRATVVLSRIEVSFE